MTNQINHALLRELHAEGRYDDLIALVAPDGFVRSDDFLVSVFLGAAHLSKGEYLRAEEIFRALAFKAPDMAEAWNNLGVALQHQGRLTEAAEVFERALSLRPLYYDALMNQGKCSAALQDWERALSCFERVLRDCPPSGDLFYNLGIARHRLGYLGASRRAFLAALAYDESNVLARVGLGCLDFEEGDHHQAEQTFRTALATQPRSTQALSNLVQVLLSQGKLEAALAMADEALAVDINLSAVATQRRYLLGQMCQWSEPSADTVLFEAGADHPASPFPFLAFEDSPERQQVRSQQWALKKYPAGRGITRVRGGAARGGSRYRVGYFSSDIHDHATLHLLQGVWREHDRERFEVHLFSYGRPRQSEMRDSAIGAVEHFHDVHGLADGEIVALAVGHGLELAIDLKGYTTETRSGLFAHGLAPVQASYLGYPGTMGADFIDYLIADHVVIPPSERCWYSEKIVYLPGSYQANDDRRVIASNAGTRADWGLPEQGFVFCCFNNTYKITPDEFGIWMDLLAAVDGSVLWLLGTNRWAQENLHREAQARGIAPGRLVFAPPVANAEHLARHCHADLFLDTFSYNAHTTASDALWAGLPVVTLAGRQFAARVGASLLHACGLAELVTATREDYAALALALARDPQKLAELRARLDHSTAMPALFDTPRFTRNLENAFATMIERSRAGIAVDHIVLSQVNAQEFALARG